MNIFSRIFHVHKWVSVSAFCDRQLHYDPMPPAGYYLITHVAQRCSECGKVRSADIRGWHSLEWLAGEHDEVTRVLRQLEK